MNVLSQERQGTWVTGLPETVTVITVGQDYVIDGQTVEPRPRSRGLADAGDARCHIAPAARRPGADARHDHRRHLELYRHPQGVRPRHRGAASVYLHSAGRHLAGGRRAPARQAGGGEAARPRRRQGDDLDCLRRPCRHPGAVPHRHRPRQGDRRRAHQGRRGQGAVARRSRPADRQRGQFSLQPTLVIALSGNVPERTLFDRARALQDAIETVPSVLEARLTGQRDELLEVIIDKQKLRILRRVAGRTAHRVQRNNRLVAAGAVDSGNGRFTLKVPGTSTPPPTSCRCR